MKTAAAHGCGRRECPKQGMYSPSGGLFCLKCGWLVARDVREPVTTEREEDRK